MSLRVTSDAKDTLDGLTESVQANSHKLTQIIQLMGPIGPRLELIDKIGPRLELIDKIAQQAHLLEQLGPRLELIDQVFSRLTDLEDMSTAVKSLTSGLQDFSAVFELATSIVKLYLNENHLVSESVRIDVESLQSLVTSIQVQMNQLATLTSDVGP